MRERDVDHLLIVTDHRAGNAPQWVTGWPGTVEAYVIFQPGQQMTMHVEWYNHFPLAKKLARDCDVRWGEHRGIEKTIEELKRRGAKQVGLIGPLVHRKVLLLQEQFEIQSLEGDYVRLRLVKSEEEIDWLRIGAALSDAGFDELLKNTRPGLTERDISDFLHQQLDEYGLEPAWDRAQCPIVSAGPNSPWGHVGPTDTALEPGHLLHIDFGVKYQGYCSDMQRTYYFLKPGETDAPETIHTHFAIIDRCIQDAARFIKPGVAGWEVDAIARAIRQLAAE